MVVEGDTDTVEFAGIEKVLEEPGTQMRIFGKEYVVEDGDIMHFLFNV